MNKRLFLLILYIGTIGIRYRIQFNRILNTKYRISATILTHC